MEGKNCQLCLLPKNTLNHFSPSHSCRAQCSEREECRTHTATVHTPPRAREVRPPLLPKVGKTKGSREKMASTNTTLSFSPLGCPRNQGKGRSAHTTTTTPSPLVVRRRLSQQHHPLHRRHTAVLAAGGTSGGGGFGAGVATEQTTAVNPLDDHVPVDRFYDGRVGTHSRVSDSLHGPYWL